MEYHAAGKYAISDIAETCRIEATMVINDGNMGQISVCAEVLTGAFVFIYASAVKVTGVAAAVHNKKSIFRRRRGQEIATNHPCVAYLDEEASYRYKASLQNKLETCSETLLLFTFHRQISCLTGTSEYWQASLTLCSLCISACSADM